MKWYLLIIIGFLLTTCDKQSQNKRAEDTSFAKEAWINPLSDAASTALLKSRIDRIKNYQKSGKPFLQFTTNDKNKILAQNIIAEDPKLKQFTHDQETNEPFLVEMFEIAKANPSNIPERIVYHAGLYQASLYNFAKNSTLRLTVDITAKQIVDANFYDNFQPDLTPPLEQLATAIAINNPKVIEALGYKPNESEALMAATKTALNKTKCERSFHLCCAPTFIKDDKALWVIVDLTDLRVVGIRWTNVGDAGPQERISEKKLLVDKVEECNCKNVNTVKKENWKVNYVLTSSDGLRIYDVQYKNEPYLDDAKLVDWHVSYSNSDGFGYSDAIGCPSFSHAAVTAYDVARVADLIEDDHRVGFVIEQTFKSKQWPQPCNYNYVQRYEFYTDGRFRMAAGSLGRGCGTDGTYRPVFRLVFSGEKQNFSQWTSNSWTNWNKENWHLQEENSEKKDDKHLYKIESNQKSYYIEPSEGQFNDGGRGDFAYSYVTKYHHSANEGNSDLMTIGPCCNTNHEQGPEKFINNESIENCKLVFWYVPKLKNDGVKGREYCWAESFLENGVYKTRSFPCIAGPMFTPIFK